VVAVAFQIDVFFIFLKLFLRSMHQNDLKHIKNGTIWHNGTILAKNVFLNFLETRVDPRFQTSSNQLMPLAHA
jgi:hypothetical protein